MRVASGDLLFARNNPDMVGRKVGDGFRIVREVQSKALSRYTDELVRRVVSVHGTLTFARPRQAFSLGLTILGDRMLQQALDDENRGAEWEHLKNRDLRDEFSTIAGLAVRESLPFDIPARAASFYYERSPEMGHSAQRIRCQLGQKGRLNPQQQQQHERVLFTREGLGSTIASLERPLGNDGVLNYANFPSSAPESTIRGITDTLNEHIAEVGINVSVMRLTYQVYSGSN